MPEIQWTDLPKALRNHLFDRLVVAMKYEFSIVYIRFIGTHEEYDKLNVEEV